MHLLHQGQRKTLELLQIIPAHLHFDGGGEAEQGRAGKFELHTGKRLELSAQFFHHLFLRPADHAFGEFDVQLAEILALFGGAVAHLRGCAGHGIYTGDAFNLLCQSSHPRHHAVGLFDGRARRQLHIDKKFTLADFRNQL